MRPCSRSFATQHTDCHQTYCMLSWGELILLQHHRVQSVKNLLLAIYTSFTCNVDTTVNELKEASLHSLDVNRSECSWTLGLLVKARKEVWLAQCPLKGSAFDSRSDLGPAATCIPQRLLHHAAKRLSLAQHKYTPTHITELLLGIGCKPARQPARQPASQIASQPAST